MSKTISVVESRRRLNILADHIETLPDERIDMGKVFSDTKGEVADPIGHACSIPEFKKLGLTGDPDKNTLTYSKSEQKDPARIACEFFGLDLSAESNFARIGYAHAPSAKEVADRLRSLAA